MADDEAQRRAQEEAQKRAEEAAQRRREEDAARKAREIEKSDREVQRSMLCPHGNIIGQCQHCR
jgi:hypothetical protein